MKIRILPILFTTLLFVGSIAPLTGCSLMPKKSGVDLAEKSTTSMQDVETDIREANAQIDPVSASLNNVITVGQSSGVNPAEVKKAFTDYSKNVDEMQKLNDRLSKDLEQMNASVNNYFQQWTAQGATYTNPELQKLSQEERARLRTSFTELESRSAGVRGNLNAYLAEIKQIQMYLSNDLTPTGISRVSSIAKTAEQKGNELKASFKPVLTELAQTRAELTPGYGAAAGGGQATGKPSSQGSSSSAGGGASADPGASSNKGTSTGGGTPSSRP